MMLKSADVRLAGYETVGDGLCTAIVRGTISNVTIAIEAGMYEAERIGELHAVMVIPNPLNDLDNAIPTASCWLEEEPEPLPILLPKKKDKEIKEEKLVELPVLEPVPQKVEVNIPEKLEIPIERQELE